jgi:hypothetical protein
MAKKPSIFAGLTLSEQTPTVGPPVEQRLFTPAPKAPVPAGLTATTPDEPPSNPPTVAAATPRQTSQSEPPQEARREGGKEGRRESSQEGGKEDFLLTSTTGMALYDLNTKPNRKDSFLFTDEEFFELKHVKLELQEQYQFDVGKDDIVRCAFSVLFRDYRKNGEQSALVQALRNKRGK